MSRGLDGSTTYTTTAAIPHINTASPRNRPLALWEAAELFGDVYRVANYRLVDQFACRIDVAAKDDRAAARNGHVGCSFDERTISPVGSDLLRRVCLAVTPCERCAQHKLDGVVPRAWCQLRARRGGVLLHSGFDDLVS